MVRSFEAGASWPRALTEPRLRRVLMLCFPLSPSSSSLTGLNINGGGSTGFSMGGSSPYFLKWMRQSVQSRMFSRPPWCQSLEAAWGKRGGGRTSKSNISGTSRWGARPTLVPREPALRAQTDPTTPTAQGLVLRHSLSLPGQERGLGIFFPTYLRVPRRS